MRDGQRVDFVGSRGAAPAWALLIQPAQIALSYVDAFSQWRPASLETEAAEESCAVQHVARGRGKGNCRIE